MKISEIENHSSHILLSKVQNFVTVSDCILTAENATRAKLSLVDSLIDVLHKNVDYGVFMMIFIYSSELSTIFNTKHFSHTILKEHC